jgi:hypothetical protein
MHPFQLLRPKFSDLLMPEDETMIFDLVERLIQTLSSSDVAIDDRHTPKLHARFLLSLLSKCRREYAETGRSQPQNPPSSQTVRHGPYGLMSPSGSSSQVFSVSLPQSRLSPPSQPQKASNFSPAFEFAVPDTTRPDVANEVPTYQGVAGAYAENLGMHEEGDAPTTSVSSSTGEGTPATLQTLRNPTLWTQMMMPGYARYNPLIALR